MIGKQLRRKSDSVQKEQGYFMSIIDETLNGQKIIKTFNAKGFFSKRFEASTQRFFNFSNALDFYRISKNMVNYNIFHHIGIYAFTSIALIRYVSLERSKLELERKLEQLRALENGMKIHSGYVNYSPLSVDTEEDLIKVRKIMKK